MFKVASRIPSHVLIVAAFGLLLLLNACFGEISYIGGGVGWDGDNYAGVVKKFYYNPAEVFTTLTPYDLQRILPSAVGAALLKLLHLPCDHNHVIWFFRWYNFCLLTAAVYVWTLIARRMVVYALNYVLDNKVALKNFSWNAYQPPMKSLNPDSWFRRDGPREPRLAVIEQDDFDIGQITTQFTTEEDSVGSRRGQGSSRAVREVSGRPPTKGVVGERRWLWPSFALPAWCG